MRKKWLQMKKEINQTDRERNKERQMVRVEGRSSLEGLQPLSSSYCYSSVCVWRSSIKPANTGLRINKLDTLCCRYLSSSLSTPTTALANFSQLPLPEEKRRHTVAILCGIEVLLHLYENKLFFWVRRMRELARVALSRCRRRGGLWFHTELRTLLFVRKWRWIKITVSVWLDVIRPELVGL